MKLLHIFALSLILTHISASPPMPCASISELAKILKQSKTPEKILFQMGKSAEKIAAEAPLDEETFSKNPDYKNICHYKIVRSENFGDFPSYSGYHYVQILKKYPHSTWADDAAFALIYVITEKRYNFSDIRLEKQKLQTFLAKYPQSNKAKEAKMRILEIKKTLESGGSAILD